MLPPSSAEFSDGYGHRIAQNAIIAALRRAGLPVAARSDDWYAIRDNRRQVVELDQPMRPIPSALRRPGDPTFNIPDISYVARGGRRVNVEVDTSDQGSQDHIRSLIEADSKSRHIGYVVDRLGNVVARRAYNPRTGLVTVNRNAGRPLHRRFLDLPAPLVPPGRSPGPAAVPPVFTAGRRRRAAAPRPVRR